MSDVSIDGNSGDPTPVSSALLMPGTSLSLSRSRGKRTADRTIGSTHLDHHGQHELHYDQLPSQQSQHSGHFTISIRTNSNFAHSNPGDLSHMTPMQPSAMSQSVFSLDHHSAISDQQDTGNTNMPQPDALLDASTELQIREFLMSLPSSNMFDHPFDHSTHPFVYPPEIASSFSRQSTSSDIAQLTPPAAMALPLSSSTNYNSQPAQYQPVALSQDGAVSTLSFQSQDAAGVFQMQNFHNADIFNTTSFPGHVVSSPTQGTGIDTVMQDYSIVGSMTSQQRFSTTSFTTDSPAAAPPHVPAASIDDLLTELFSDSN
eukprot:jgi/Hompol1/2376/HPOL_005993-RA